MKKLALKVYMLYMLKKGYKVHEKHVNTLFQQHGLKHVFMTNGDPSQFTDELLNRYFTPTIKEKRSIGVLSCTLNDILSYEEVVKMYWAYPAITEQGSHNGLLSSTISTKERSTKRRVKWFIQRLYKTYFLHFIK